MNIEPPDFAGKTFEGKWIVSGRIGTGGFAWVYKATRPLIGLDAAIKVLQPLPGGGYLEETRERFLLEAKLTVMLKNPHTLTVHSFGEEEIDGQTYMYLISEYVDGPTLTDYLEEHGPLHPLELVIILKQIASSLYEAHTHQSPFIHRDLKCANVMLLEHQTLAQGPFVKVLDYGIGKAIRAGTTIDKNLTTRGDLNLSVFYAAPEQLGVGGNLGAWTDLYALGMVAYECLVGHSPYEGKTQPSVILELANSSSITLPPRHQKGPLAPIIHKLLEKRIEHRYQSCAELIDDLNRLQIKEDRLVSPPVDIHTQDAAWISEILAKREFDDTQTIREGLFDPSEDQKTLTFQKEVVSSPALLVPSEIAAKTEQDESEIFSTQHAKVSPDSRALEFESEHPTRPLQPTSSPTKTVKVLAAFLALVLLGGGISGAILMALESPSSEKEASYQTTSTHTEKPPLMVGEIPVDLVLTTKVATSRVSGAIKRARTDMKDSAALAAKEKLEEEIPAKQPRVADSSRKATKLKVEKVTRNATKEAKSTPSPVTKTARTSPAVAAKKDASTTTTTPAPRPKETSAPKEEKEEYRFFGVP